MQKTVKENLKVTRVREFTRRFFRNYAGAAGFAIVLFFAVIAVLAPMVAPYPPEWKEVDYYDPDVYGPKYDLAYTDKAGIPHNNYQVFVEEVTFQPPSAEHPFGTDKLGRDILSRVIFGSRISLTIGFGVALVSAAIGVVLGALSGYYGGLTDNLIQRITEVFLTLPILPTIILFSVFFGASVYILFVVLVILGWQMTVRITRGEYLRLKNEAFVEAARAVGSSNTRIMFRHILPSALPPIVTATTLNIGGWIITEASLAYLGLGDPDRVSWGTIIFEAQKSGAIFDFWWLSMFAGFAVVLVVLGFFFLANALTDLLNPKLS